MATLRVSGMLARRGKIHGVPLPAFFRPPPPPRPPRPPPSAQKNLPRERIFKVKPLGHLYREVAPVMAKDPEEEGRPMPVEIPEGGFLPLWNLRDNEGSRKQKTRLGRGIGSGKGKTCGRGHKGQKARSGHKPRLGFEGGQTPLRVRLPKRGFKNPFTLHFKLVGLAKLKEYIEKGKIDPSKLITMKTLKETGCSGKYIRDGVKLLARGYTDFNIPIHIEVSRVSSKAKEAIEAAGGSVRKVHYNKLGLKALCDPDWFKRKGRLLPQPARPKPKIKPKVDDIGRLPAPISPILPEGFKLKAAVHGYPSPETSKGDTKDAT